MVILGVAVENPFPSLEERTTSGLLGLDPTALQRRSGVTATAVCEPEPLVFPWQKISEPTPGQSVGRPDPMVFTDHHHRP